jgi:folate-binding protein YgfZ
MPNYEPIELPGYQQAATGIAYYHQKQSGCLYISGRDRVDFLQRQSTNNLTRLLPGRSIVTVLTSPTARILDVLRLILDGDQLMALPLPGRSNNTASYLKNRIFFMDQVDVTDVSADLCQFDLEGPGISDLLTDLGLIHQPFAEDQVIDWELNGAKVKLVGQPGFAGLGLRLVAPEGACLSLEAFLQSKGAAALDEPTYHVCRVEAGMPYSGAELTEDYTPLEIGLESYVADDKGCYTGQEVISRQTNYDKITQRLVGLEMKSETQPETRLWAEGKSAGKITSIAISPRFGQIALAVVKRPYDHAGTTLKVDNAADPAGTEVTVTDLPFAESP